MEISEWGAFVSTKIAFIALGSAGDVFDFRYREYAPSANDSTPWSAILQETLAEDNTATGNPSISLVSTTVEVIAPPDINVAYLNITGVGAPGIVPVQPNEIVTFTVDPGDAPWLATAYTSNGTASGTVST